MMRSLRGLAAPLLNGLNQRRRQAPSGREEGMARLPKGNLQNDRSRSIRQDVFSRKSRKVVEVSVWLQCLYLKTVC